MAYGGLDVLVEGCDAEAYVGWKTCQKRRQGRLEW